MHEILLIGECSEVIAFVDAIARASRSGPASWIRGFRTDDQRRVISQLPSQALCAGHLGCPGDVVELRQAQVVQARRSQAGAAELPADDIAPIGE